MVSKKIVVGANIGEIEDFIKIIFRSSGSRCLIGTDRENIGVEICWYSF